MIYEDLGTVELPYKYAFIMSDAGERNSSMKAQASCFWSRIMGMPCYG